jgi:predicted ATPase
VRITRAALLVLRDHHRVFHACNHVLDAFVREEVERRGLITCRSVASAELTKLVQTPAVQRAVLCGVTMSTGFPN